MQIDSSGHPIRDEHSSGQLAASEEQPLAVGRGDSGVQDGGLGELHHAGSRGTGGRLQLQDRNVVWVRRAEDAGRHKEGHLGSPGGPVAPQVDAVNPNLALK